LMPAKRADAVTRAERLEELIEEFRTRAETRMEWVAALKDPARKTEKVAKATIQRVKQRLKKTG